MPYEDKDKQREFQRNWVAKRRADWFSNKSCVRCGSQEDLQIDHIDPKTKSHLLKSLHNNAIWSWSEKRREDELAKCQVLCDPCHKEKTRENGDIGQVGSINPNSKLNEDDIVLIRILVAGGMSQVSVAKLYGVVKSSINGIIKGTTWTHVK
jgi:5-methylcytosine-specific restriction endonuclease McrA